jgi:hypothetical protein
VRDGRDAGDLEDLGGHFLMARLRLCGTADDYRRMVEEGLAQLHVFRGGFAITEVKDYTHPSERVLNVLLMGGKKLDEWKHEVDAKLVSFARVNGCNAIEFACRLGIERKFSEFGYSRKRVLMRKEVGLDEQTILENRGLRAAA